MTEISVHDCQRQVDCTCDDECYSVRDNGVVMRNAKPREGWAFRPIKNRHKGRFIKKMVEGVGFGFTALRRVCGLRPCREPFDGSNTTPKRS